MIKFYSIVLCFSSDHCKRVGHITKLRDHVKKLLIQTHLKQFLSFILETVFYC